MTSDSLVAFLVELAHYSPAGATPGDMLDRIKNVGNRAAALLESNQQLEVTPVRTLEELRAGDLVRVTSVIEVNSTTDRKHLPGIIDQSRLLSAIEKGQVERIAPTRIEPDWKLGDFGETSTGEIYYLRRRPHHGELMWLWIDAPADAEVWYSKDEMRGKLKLGWLVQE